MSRAPLIVANWKMNKTPQEGASFIQALKTEVSSFKKRVWIAPSFVSLPACVQAASSTSICIGAQNMHAALEGAFTGEVSGSMLKSLGVTFVILGHSERRRYFKETDQEIHAKVKTALSLGLIPVVCIGENLSEREKGKEKEVLKQQLQGCLHDIASLSQVVIAYEPVWAIGTGKVATPEIAQEAHRFIRDCLEELGGREASEKMSLLYGGSVTAASLNDLLAQTDIDGVLVGGASLEMRSLIQMIES